MEYVPQKSKAFYMLKLRVERLGYYFSAYPDSQTGQIGECLELLKDTPVIDFERTYNLLAYYGMALQQILGREREEVKYLEESYQNFLADDYLEGMLFIGDELVRVYIRTGLTERIFVSLWSIPKSQTASKREKIRMSPSEPIFATR